MLSYMALLDSQHDKDKFQQIYERYYQPMYRTARQIVGDEHSARDCVHDAFLKIIERLPDLPQADDSRTRSFVLIAVRNRAVNLYRERKRREAQPVDDEALCHLPRLWVYDRYDTGEGEELVRFLLEMSPIYRDVLTLKYVEEYSNGEISDLLGITEALVRKRLERARKILARRWKEWEEQDGAEKGMD